MCNRFGTLEVGWLKQLRAGASFRQTQRRSKLKHMNTMFPACTERSATGLNEVAFQLNLNTAACLGLNLNLGQALQLAIDVEFEIRLSRLGRGFASSSQQLYTCTYQYRLTRTSGLGSFDCSITHEPMATPKHVPTVHLCCTPPQPQGSLTYRDSDRLRLTGRLEFQPATVTRPSGLKYRTRAQWATSSCSSVSRGGRSGPRQQLPRVWVCTGLVLLGLTATVAERAVGACAVLRVARRDLVVAECASRMTTCAPRLQELDCPRCPRHVGHLKRSLHPPPNTRVLSKRCSS